MNHASFGFSDDKLFKTTEPFLLVDDGPVAELFKTQFPNATVFNPRRHSFNPLPMNYKKARDFATLLYSISPQGENTLTVRNGKRALRRLLLTSTRLDRMTATNEDEEEAKGMVDDLLFSPVLTRVLTRKPNFNFNGSVIAIVNRAELGDEDALALANLLVLEHKGHIVVPDAFYLRDIHTSLIRQGRLTVGVNYLEELPPKLKAAVLTIKDKTAYRTNLDDAERLLPYFRKITKPSQITDLEDGDFLTT